MSRCYWSSGSKGSEVVRRRFEKTTQQLRKYLYGNMAGTRVRGGPIGVHAEGPLRLLALL